MIVLQMKNLSLARFVLLYSGSRSPFLTFGQGKSVYVTLDSTFSHFFGSYHFGSSSNAFLLSKSKFSHFLDSPIKMEEVFIKNATIVHSGDYKEHSSLKVMCCQFKDCSVSDRGAGNSHGGAISYNNSAGSLVIEHSFFQTCSSLIWGGAVYALVESLHCHYNLYLDCFAGNWGHALMVFPASLVANVSLISSANTFKRQSLPMGSHVHIYNDGVGDYRFINTSGETFTEDGGFSCPGSSGPTTVMYITTQHVNAGSLIALSLLTLDQHISHLSFSNFTVKHGLVWLRGSENIVLNNVILNGTLPSLRHIISKPSVTVTLRDSYSTGSRPLDMTNTIEESSVFWDVPHVTLYSLPDIHTRLCNPSHTFTSPHLTTLPSISPFLVFNLLL